METINSAMKQWLHQIGVADGYMVLLMKVSAVIGIHPKVNKEMTMLVRQLQPTAEGLPIELYFFSADTAWLCYEHLQGEVFDHVLATLHTFDLKVFQNPTGLDLQRIRN